MSLVNCRSLCLPKLAPAKLASSVKLSRQKTTQHGQAQLTGDHVNTSQANTIAWAPRSVRVAISLLLLLLLLFLSLLLLSHLFMRPNSLHMTTRAVDSLDFCTVKLQSSKEKVVPFSHSSRGSTRSRNCFVGSFALSQP